MSAKGKIARAAGLMSIATFISRILGYVKDMILARYFGATGMADVFFVAFRIPNLLRELFAEGSMSSAFVPVLTEYRTKDGKEEADRLVRSTFIVILVFVGIICIFGIIFAPAIVTTIAPGFLNDPDKFSDTVLLTRIMFPFLLFISLAALTMGALNTRGVFFIPALAPAFLNIVTIISVLTLSMHFTNPIISVAIGVTAGGLVQFLFQMPSFFKQGYSFRSQKSEVRSQTPPLNPPLAKGGNGGVWHPGLKRIGLLIIPATAGMAVAQINIFVSTILASYLAEGSITYLYYSMRLIQFPIGIFGVAMGMAVLPALSEHSVKGEMEKVKEDFSFALRLLFFITVPAMMGLIALKTPIVSTLFQRGEFGYAATIGTSDALMFYSLGIWAIVGVRVTTATFYSMQDTKTPVKVAAAAMIINIIMSLLLMGPMGHSGLAFANAIASGFNFIVLFYFLRKKLGGVGTKRITGSFAKTLLASAVMGGAGWVIVRSEIWTLSGYGIQKTAYLGSAIIICGGIYMLLAYLLKSEEMGYIIEKARQKIGRKDAD
ncbi:MAG: murein biosynthesis integral membrane protein MurJ [Nitrospirae bacterium]|nr:murein biosynthesis integral membrane protein MurJ [Nitrospirota bacterium]